MIKGLIFITVAVIYFTSCSMLPKAEKRNCGKYGDFCNVKVVDFYDGDTFFIDLAHEHHIFGDRLGVRVKGVNTPELRSSSQFEKMAARAARDYTKQNLLEAKKVDLLDCTKGKYFRIVCYVKIDRDRDLSQELLDKGLAVPYDK